MHCQQLEHAFAIAHQNRACKSDFHHRLASLVLPTFPLLHLVACIYYIFQLQEVGYVLTLATVLSVLHAHNMVVPCVAHVHKVATGLIHVL